MPALSDILRGAGAIVGGKYYTQAVNQRRALDLQAEEAQRRAEADALQRKVTLAQLAGLEQKSRMERETQRRNASLADMLAPGTLNPQAVGAQGPPAPQGYARGLIASEQARRGKLGEAAKLLSPRQAKAPTVRNFTEGTDIVARRWNPQMNRWEEVARGPRAAMTGERPLLGGAFGEKGGQDLLDQSVKAGDDAVMAQQLYRDLVSLGGGVTGIRAKISEKGGGLLGQIPVVGAALERGVTEAVSNVSPEQLADFRVKSGALIARSVEPITGEGSSRVSDQEWQRTASITKLDTATATPAQLGAALKSVARLNMLTEDRKHIMATGTPQFPLKTDEQINNFGNSLVEAGYDEAAALEIVKEFIAHRESLRQKGLLRNAD